MEKDPNQRERKNAAHKKAISGVGRPKASPIDDFAACPSPVCRFIRQARSGHRQLILAECCSTIFTKRSVAKLSHPTARSFNWEAWIEIKQIANHNQFHKFLQEEGLELTIDQTHQEPPFSIPQHEVQIDQPILQEHHQIEKETQTTTPEQMVPKSLFDEERYMRMDYERKLQSVFELLTQWERSGDIGRSCFAQEMRNTLASKR